MKDKNLPFNSFNNFMKNLFKCRVYKISIDAGFTCPNRDGKKGYDGCIFCDERGSSSRTNDQKTPIKEQILKNIKIRKSRYRAKKFIIYFQSFTNTYGSLEKLEKIYTEALYSHKDIIGMSIATRSDCVDEEKIKLIASYKKKFPFICIEYGMQTSHNRTLEKINRKETFEDFKKALFLTKKYKLNHCAHIILNLPSETIQDQLKTAKTISDLKIEGIKIHPLVVLKDTALEKIYLKGEWKPFSFEKYISLVCDFIQKIHKSCIIHRVSSSGYPKDIVAPIWAKEKDKKVLTAVLKKFEKRGTRQGCELNQVVARTF